MDSGSTTGGWQDNPRQRRPAENKMDGQGPGQERRHPDYYWQSAHKEIWLLTIYAKNEAENIPAHILKRIREAMEP